MKTNTSVFAALAVLALCVPSALADTLVPTNTTQDGGTFTVQDDSVLLVTDPNNDPTLSLINGATASFQGATVIGSLDGESGNLELLSGSTLTNNGTSTNLGTYGSVSALSGGGYLGLNSGSTGTATVSGDGSTWTNDGQLRVGSSGTGSLTVENGGSVSNTWGLIGVLNGSEGTVLVTGVDSTWTNDGQLRVGSSGTGSLTVENGGSVSNTWGTIGALNGSEGTVLVTGAGSTWTNTDNLILGGFSLTNETTGGGTLSIRDGAEVTVGSSSRIWGGSTIEIEVVSSHTTAPGGTHALSIDSNLTNDGLIRLIAAPDASEGTYAPLSVGGTWTGTGTLQTIGGTWDAGENEFVIAPSTTGTNGISTDIDLTTSQRLQVTGSGGSQLLVAFDASGQSNEESSTIAFTATQLSLTTIDGEQVLVVWNFATDLTPGTDVQLSMEVGSGWDSSLFSAWHSDDNGSTWTLLDSAIEYDDFYASFMVDGFSSFAITAIPEPATVAALLGALVLVGVVIVRRRRRA